MEVTRSELNGVRMSFDAALRALKAGHAVTRAGWNGKGQWIKAQMPDAHSLMTKPYVYIRTVQGDCIPWLVSQGDLFAEDWVIVKDKAST